jgi:hypothetical protein
MSVQAHVTHEGSTALQCLELVTNQSVLWIEGIRGQCEFRLFGQTFNAQDSEYIGVRCDGVYWTVTIPLSKTAIGLGIALELKDRRIPIPMMQIEYAQPVPWLSGVRSKHINTATA